MKDSSMPKKSSKFITNFGHWLVSHPWLKFIALILAIMVWFYVRGEISRFDY